MPYLVNNYEPAAVMLDVFLSAVNNDEHLSEEGFTNLMGYLDSIRKERRYGSGVKYTQQYFADLWELDLDQEQSSAD